MNSRKIKITCGGAEAEAALNDSRTADLLWEALPISARINTWGDEIYFTIPVNDNSSPDAVDVVQKGDIAYWPPGKAFCIFWGMTPASQGDEIRPASAVNPLGKILGDASVFVNAPGGSEMVLERL